MKKYLIYHFGGGRFLASDPCFESLFKTIVSGQAARLGFTLAEVLVTLGIIGVVAALTMPALIGNYQKQANIAGLKKAQSVLSQACMNIVRERV